MNYIYKIRDKDYKVVHVATMMEVVADLIKIYEHDYPDRKPFTCSKHKLIPDNWHEK